MPANTGAFSQLACSRQSVEFPDSFGLAVQWHARQRGWELSMIRGVHGAVEALAGKPSLSGNCVALSGLNPRKNAYHGLRSDRYAVSAPPVAKN